MKLTCIMCPVGCQLEVTKQGKEYVVTGNNCIRGERYGKEEVTAPKRILTTLIQTHKGVLPVKTTLPIPKEKIMEANRLISKMNIAEGKSGDIVVSNILGTGADVVITGDYVVYDL